jgi:tRNA (guanine26-N2/guanine27-N2)-dimethyltransferase
VSLRLCREGAVEFYAEPARTSLGPASRNTEVFYNPAMRHSRDVSVCACRAMGFASGDRLLDGLAASGVRGLRIAVEGCPDAEVTMNDRGDAAFRAIRRNIGRNTAINALAAHEDLRVLLHQERFDYVDVDPFGSPVPFMDAALRGTRKPALLAVTATDTAALCGTYPRTCERRYLARSLRNECAHELGARILAGFVVRLAAVHDIAAQPLLCYSREHYFRCYFRLQSGARRADALMWHLAYANFEPGGERWVSEHPEAERWAGKLWSGELVEPQFIDGLAETEAELALGIAKDVATWSGESGAPALHHDVSELSHAFRTSQPRMEQLIAGLREMGYVAVRTSFAPTGLRTDAPVKDIKRLFPRP